MNAAIRALRTIILASPPLADLLATPGGHAVRQGDASEIDSPPYVLLWRITDRPIYDLAAKTGIRAALVQIDCYAATKTQASAIAGSIAGAIAAFGRGYAGDVWVTEIIEEDTRDRDNRDREGADQPLAVVQTDYRIIYRG